MSAYNKPFDLQSASSLLRVFISFRRVEADREYEDALTVAGVDGSRAGHAARALHMLAHPKRSI